MHSRCVFLVFAFVLVCFCTVSSRNVEKTRTKRNNKDLDQSCEKVKAFFEMRNVSVLPLDKPQGKLCKGQCCGAEAETILKAQGQKDFAALLRHNSRTLQGLLNSTATVIQGHVLELATQSENITLQLFAQVYQQMAVLSKDPISDLYRDVRRSVQINSSQDALSTDSTDLKESVSRFFVDLFPLVYHHILSTLARDFSHDYKVCVKMTFSEIQPFGDIPRQLAQSLSKSLEATRLLLQAFNVGMEVLNTTDLLFTEDGGKRHAECHNALLKMTYCPKCQGLEVNTKPCSGYCLNVLRGCLTKYVTELDAPWNSYVEALERLISAIKQHNNEAGVNADMVIRTLDTKISQAIMHAMEKGRDIDIRVKRSCGVAKLSEQNHLSIAKSLTTASPASSDSSSSTVSSSSSSTTAGGSKPRVAAKVRIFSQPPNNHLIQFVGSIGKSRGFYGNLAESLCKDDSFAEPKDQHCWNGERIGEYSQTIVDVRLDMQKYNPEVKPSIDLQNIDPRIANLADKLRHVHQMVKSSLGVVGLPEADNYMQSDSADGSGSGEGPDMDDSDDEYSRTGSGSGGGPIIHPTNSDTDNSYPPSRTDNEDSYNRGYPPQQPPTAGVASYCNSLYSVLVLLTVLVLTRF